MLFPWANETVLDNFVSSSSSGLKRILSKNRNLSSSEAWDGDRGGCFGLFGLPLPRFGDPLLDFGLPPLALPEGLRPLVWEPPLLPAGLPCRLPSFLLLPPLLLDFWLPLLCGEVAPFAEVWDVFGDPLFDCFGDPA